MPQTISVNEVFQQIDNLVGRRTMLKASGIAAASIAFSNSRALASYKLDTKILERKVISVPAAGYCGWPTLARNANGELFVVCSGRRESHVCPFGSVELIRSKDNGKSWSWPRTLYDGPIDDRDAGICVTAKGTILVTTFTSLAYESVLAHSGNWPEKKRNQWNAIQERTTAEQRKKELGTWMLRSTDGGVTWSKRYDSIVNSPHGPIQLSDGRLLYAGVQLWKPGRKVGVCESSDDGKSWKWLAEIPARKGDRHAEYHELHAVQANDGTIVVHIRNHNKISNRETLQTVSTDGGKSWRPPKSIGVWGLPSHLTKLKNGNLLMSYGHRRKPFGNQARVSSDNGATWSKPIMISDDGSGGDLGYPSTVELDDGSLITVWYEKMANSSKAVLRMAHWQIG